MSHLDVDIVQLISVGSIVVLAAPRSAGYLSQQVFVQSATIAEADGVDARAGVGRFLHRPTENLRWRQPLVGQTIAEQDNDAFGVCRCAAQGVVGHLQPRTDVGAIGRYQPCDHALGLSIVRGKSQVQPGIGAEGGDGHTVGDAAHLAFLFHHRHDVPRRPLGRFQLHPTSPRVAHAAGNVEDEDGGCR